MNEDVIARIERGADTENNCVAAPVGVGRPIKLVAPTA